MAKEKIKITAPTFLELCKDGAQWLEAEKRFNAYLKRAGWNIGDYVNKYAGEPHQRGYDLMMRRTDGEFSAKEWLLCVIS